jgi:hypothetical protein
MAERHPEPVVAFLKGIINVGAGAKSTSTRRQRASATECGFRSAVCIGISRPAFRCGEAELGETRHR